MNQINKIGFLGGGKMAQALAKGFISAGLVKAENITASVHPSDELSFKEIQRMGSVAVKENKPVMENSNVIFLSTKPVVAAQVLQEIKSYSDDKLFISIMMGTPLKQIENSLSSRARVIRAMPNTPAIVQAACSVFVRGEKALDDDVKLTQLLFESIGTCEEIPESQIDIVTALSGSGPAYVFVMIEALADGAVRMGMTRDLAYRLASQTVLGAGQMVRDLNEHPGKLKDNVTSPAGSTAAALKHLESKGFRSLCAGAVEMATIRCREVSGATGNLSK